MSEEILKLSPTARRVLISMNPKAGARSGESPVHDLAHDLEQRGYQPEVSTDIDQIAAAADSYHRHGELRAVVAAGGDGTVSLVTNRTAPGVPVAVLPLGTENLLAKYLQLPTSAKGIAALIDAGTSVRLDAGCVGDRLFLLMLGCGFDADVVHRLHGGRRGHIHHLSYAKPILESIRNYQYPELRVIDLGTESADERPKEGTTGEGTTGEGAALEEGAEKQAARWVFVANLPRYAGGLSFVPEASGTDGKLDVCTFRQGSLFNGLYYLTGVVFGQHQTMRDCRTFQARRLRIESDGKVPYQLDGDPGGYLPVEVHVIPGRLRVVVSSDWAEANLSSDSPVSDSQAPSGPVA